MQIQISKGGAAGKFSENHEIEVRNESRGEFEVAKKVAMKRVKGSSVRLGRLQSFG